MINIPKLTFNPEEKGGRVELSGDNQFAYVDTSDSFCKFQVSSDFLMQPGNIYFIQNVLTKRDHYGYGIGVATEKEFYVDIDDGRKHQNGWFFCTDPNDLKHNDEKSKFLRRSKQGDWVTMLVDTIKGEISYSMNDEPFKHGFKSPIFTQQNLKPLFFCSPKTQIKLTQPEEYTEICKSLMMDFVKNEVESNIFKLMKSIPEGHLLRKLLFKDIQLVRCMILHYLQATGVQPQIGMNMLQEIVEMCYSIKK